MYILIVEDDKLQYETIERSILESNRLSKARLERVRTELEFHEKFEEIANDNPTVILMDIMLKWTSKDRLVEPPPEVEEKGFYRAGLRCERMLANDKRTENIPVLIYSVLGIEDLEGDFEPRPQVKVLDKDFDSRGIDRAIREITA